MKRDLLPTLGTTSAALLIFATVAQAQARDEVKTEPTSRYVEDVKPVAAPHPAKPDSAPAGPIAIEGYCLPKLPQHVAGNSAFDLSERVLLDQPGDGAIWGMGGNRYKARFDGEGATYFPYLGSDAPGHTPVTFRLIEASIGGEALALDHGAAWQQQENLVTANRGGLTEVYDLRFDAMEQLYVLDQVNGSGDLVVRIAVDTELAFSENSDGFLFSGELGGVSYGRATVLDGQSESLALESRFDAGEIEIRVPAGWLATAALPVTIDPVIGTFGVDVDSGVNAYHADAAFDETNNVYTVVWEQVWNSTDRDIYSVLLDTGGALVPSSETTIDFTTDCWTHSRTANNQISDSFLVVSQSSTSCGSPWIIEGRTRNASSTTTGSQFLISGSFGGDKLFPDVGGDPVTAGPTYFCVVWERDFTSTDHDVHFQMVRADGTLLNASTQLMQNDTDDQRNPTVSKGDGQRPFSTQEWNVVWEEVFNSSDHDIYGGQVHWDGSITNGPFLIDFSGADDRHPEASTLLNDPTGATRDNLVAYDRGAGIANDIQGRMCNNGATVSASTNLSALDSPFQSTRDQIQPAVDTDGNCFALVYSEQFSTSTSDYDIYISTFTWDGTNIGVTEAHQNMAFSVDGEYSPRITANQTAVDGVPLNPLRYLAVWTDQFDPFGSPGNGDIEGGLYDSDCDLCNITFPPCPTFPNSTGFPASITIASDCSASTNDTLTVVNVPNQPGIFFHGPNDANAPFGNGTRCVGGGLVRHPVSFPVGNTTSETFNPSGTYGITAGSSIAYQYWYRDPAGGGAFFDLSNSTRVQY